MTTRSSCCPRSRSAAGPARQAHPAHRAAEAAAAVAPAAAAAESRPMITEDRLEAGLRESTARLADVVASTDESVRIPTCPDWSLRQLATHVGRGQRWAGEMVERRVTEMLPHREAPDGKLPNDPAARPGRLIARAARLARAGNAGGAHAGGALPR